MTAADALLVALDHVQLAMPAGGEPLARAFYAGILGLDEVEKPARLAGRGGAWFERGEVRVHLGVEADFRPARKAHPAFRVQGLDRLRARLEAAGVAVQGDDAIPGTRRFYAADPFGNRLEFMAVAHDDPPSDGRG